MMTINDLITVGIFFLLFGMATAVLGYFVGRKHGRIEGIIQGYEEARSVWVPKVIRAKLDGAHAGRLAELHRQHSGLPKHSLEVRC
jgi:hypothetical protein